MSFLKNLFKRPEMPKRDTENIVFAKERLDHLELLTDRLDNLEMSSFNQFELLRLATDNLDIAIWGKNQHGLFVFLNRACAEKILHSTVEEALNMTDGDFEKDSLALVCMASDNLVMEARATMRFIEHAEYGGVPYWVDCTKSPWVRNGRLIGTVGSAKDITAVVPESIKSKYRDAQSVHIGINLLLCEEEFEKMLKE